MESLTDQQLSQIDQLVLGRLEGELKATVEERIASDADWRAAYEERRLVVQSVQRDFHQKMRKRFGDLDLKHPSRRRTVVLRILGAVAAVALICVIIWRFGAVDQAEQQLADLYHPFPNVVLPIEKSASSTEARIKAYQAYEAEAYAEAAEHFEAMPVRKPEDQLYLGIALMASGQNDKAISQLQNVVGQIDSTWSPVAEWHLAWAYLNSGDPSNANSQFQMIASQPGHRYAGQALDVLKLLDR